MNKKNEKKMKKNDEKRKKNEKTWIQTQNPRRFPGFTVVVVVTSSSKSSTISMILFRNVTLSRGKSASRFAVSSFFRRQVAIFIGRETKIHIFSDENRRKKKRQSQPI